MMRKAPRPLPAAHTAALDALAQQGPNAGYAAFDAAMIQQLAAPEGAGAPFWNELAQRYHAAAKLLSEAGLRAAAEDRAKSAEAVAKAISEAPAAPPPAGK
jgi:hypothetical protein